MTSKYISFFESDISNFISILTNTIKKYIKQHPHHNFFTGDCANFAEALFKLVDYNSYRHGLIEDKDYYIMTMRDDSISHTVLFFNHLYFDADGKSTKKQIEDKFSSGDGKIRWLKDEGIYNNTGPSSSTILFDLDDILNKLKKS